MTQLSGRNKKVTQFKQLWRAASVQLVFESHGNKSWKFIPSFTQWQIKKQYFLIQRLKRPSTGKKSHRWILFLVTETQIFICSPKGCTAREFSIIQRDQGMGIWNQPEENTTEYDRSRFLSSHFGSNIPMDWTWEFMDFKQWNWAQLVRKSRAQAHQRARGS